MQQAQAAAATGRLTACWPRRPPSPGGAATAGDVPAGSARRHAMLGPASRARWSLPRPGVARPGPASAAGCAADRDCRGAWRRRGDYPGGAAAPGVRRRGSRTGGLRIGEMPPVPDADPARIAAAGWLPVPPRGTPLIIAARGTAEGARRAVIAVTALERRGIRPVAVAVVADGAGPEPRQAAQRFGLLAGGAGPLIRVPFAAALRAGADPAAARLPRRFDGRRVLPRCAGRGRAGEGGDDHAGEFSCRPMSSTSAVLAAGQPNRRGPGCLTRRRCKSQALQGPLNTIIGWGKWLVMYLGRHRPADLRRADGDRQEKPALLRGRRRRRASPGFSAGCRWPLSPAGVIGVFLHP